MWTIFSAISVIMLGLALSLMVNFELMFGGFYVLLEISCEWYSIGPSWFRRKMIAMDQVLNLIGFDEEPSVAQNSGSKTRMTLKEFMLSDS